MKIFHEKPCECENFHVITIKVPKAIQLYMKNKMTTNPVLFSHRKLPLKTFQVD